MTFDLYAWKSPRDLDADGADQLLTVWQEAGDDPGESPFEPNVDVGWFYRELTHDLPDIETLSDALPNSNGTAIWLSKTPAQPARLVAIRLSRPAPAEVLDTIFGLAAKYELVLFDTRSHRVHRPLEEMAAHASATFWPGGAIQAAVAGGVGGLLAVVAWVLEIPVLSGLLVVIGGFMVVMTVYTFIHEARKARKQPHDSRTRER
jgi:hypothetical protein